MKDPLKIYTPQMGIPLCSVEYNSDGSPVLKFKKSGEQSYEEIPFYDFISYLTACVFSISAERSSGNLSQMGRYKNK